MKIILFGSTGMVGQGVLRECLIDPAVTEVLCIGRHASGKRHVKLRDIVLADLMDIFSVESELIDFDACFFCLGISSVGLNEAAYKRVTFDITLQVARTLARLNPLKMTFIYVSGAGTDSSEHGRSMWARVKGQTENALRRLPFKSAVMFRPGLIVPLHGITSKTRLYRVAYRVAKPVLPVLHKAFPRRITTTQQVGRAMLRVAKLGAPQPIMEARDINAY